MKHVKNFLRRDEGAVTVDYVALSALVIGLIMLFVIPFLAEALVWGDSLAGLTPRSFWQ